MEISSNSKYPLCWGDPVVVRQALFNFFTPNVKIDTYNSGYECGKTTAQLERLTKILSERVLGVKHDFLVLTTGAMQALDVLFKAYKIQGRNNVMTFDTYFLFYPKVAKMNDVEFNGLRKSADNVIFLADSPSNPEGLTREFCADQGCIWDAVYNNPIYKSTITSPPIHEVAVGSFGKLFGLSGLRVGWIATNNYELAKQVKDLVDYSTCGVPTPSQSILIQILYRYLYTGEIGKSFETLARQKIDNNKDEISKISHIFDGQDLPVNGMFYFPKATDKARKILKKADVGFVEGKFCGDEDSIRLNLAQSNDLTQKAVASVLKEDKI